MHKFLFTVPDLSVIGGVASHFIGLKPHWKSNVEYFTIGRRLRWPAFITFIPDYIRFIWHLLCGTKPKAVLLNTSLRGVPVLRDFIYSLICKLFGLKTVMFIHGWEPAVYSWLTRHKRLARWIFNRHEFIYVLYSQFRQALIDVGVNIPVKLTTTKVSEELLEGFSIDMRDGVANQVLFVARADKPKGLDITIKAFEIALQRFEHLKLCVCGTGEALDAAKQYVKDHHMSNVSFEGFVTGQALQAFYRQSQIYILPTTHGEGMPTSVLEAMAMGLAVISRPVGGVNDFFVNGEMGWLIEGLEPQDYADRIMQLVDDPGLLRSIAIRNHEYAVEHFLASKVAANLESDLLSI